MVKFIVEISEGYISERADIDNAMELAKDGSSNPLRLMADLVVFKYIEKKVEEGITEFKVKCDKEASKAEISVFNDAIANLAAIAGKQMESMSVTDEDIENFDSKMREGYID